MKMAIQHENDEFLVITLKHVSGLPAILNRPGTPILWAITHENGHNTQKRRVLVITLKPVYHLGTPKLCAIAHEMTIKGENNLFLVITLKPVSGYTIILNRRGTPILWAITYENGH